MPERTPSTRNLVIGYLVSLSLIPLFVGMFPVWRFFNNLLPGAILNALPVILPIVLLVLCARIHQRGTALTGGSIHRGWIVMGLFLCGIALLLPDAQFPAKRIHVAEYLLLSLVVRFAMVQRIGGLPLLVCSAGFAAVLGIHDEFLQGLHPSRTYGLSDMTVNALASCGGAMIWHGADLFPRPAGLDSSDATAAPGLTGIYLVWLLTGILALIIPAAWYRGTVVPLWPALPLCGAFVCFSLIANRFPRSWHHGIAAVSGAACTLCLYPLLTYVETLRFY